MTQEAANLVRATVRRLLRERQAIDPALSDSVFARALGHTPSWISAYLKGRTNIDMDNLGGIARFFGLTLPAFFHEIGVDACKAATLAPSASARRAQELEAEVLALRASLASISDALLTVQRQTGGALAARPTKRPTNGSATKHSRGHG